MPASWDATAPYHQALLATWVCAGGAVRAACGRDDQQVGMAVWPAEFLGQRPANTLKAEDSGTPQLSVQCPLASDAAS